MTDGLTFLTLHTWPPMLPWMAGDDTLVVIESHLRPDDASILRGLLESAGIVSGISDEEPSENLSTRANGSVKLVVRAADAERALTMVWSAGLLRGDGPDEPAEVTPEVWSRAAEPESRRDARSLAPFRREWPQRALLAGLTLAVR